MAHSSLVKRNSVYSLMSTIASSSIESSVIIYSSSLSLLKLIKEELSHLIIEFRQLNVLPSFESSITDTLSKTKFTGKYVPRHKKSMKKSPLFHSYSSANLIAIDSIAEGHVSNYNGGDGFRYYYNEEPSLKRISTAPPKFNWRQ